MAELGIIEKFSAQHGKKAHDHDFKVEIVLEGKIDPKTEYVAGIDHYDLIAEIKKITILLEHKNLKDILSKEGLKSSGNESIARYFFKKLKPKKLPIKFIKVYETDERYAAVYATDI